MKKIECIIRPGKLDDVKTALGLKGVSGMTISQVLGFGTQKGYKEIYRGQEINVNLLPKVKIEIVVADDQLDDVISEIVNTAKTGSVGDGKIFISDIADAVRIRTGEHGSSAI